MSRTRFVGLSLPVLILMSAGCIGRPPMQQGGYPYGQPQYVTVPSGSPGPIASPQPINTPVPISSPQPSGPTSSPPIAQPPANGGGISLTPAARVGAWNNPLYQTWRTPTTFAPNAAFAPPVHYADLGRTIDGRMVSLNVSSTSARPMKAALKTGSPAEHKHRRKAGRIGQIPRQAQIVNGIRPQPEDDLKFRGGKTIKDVTFINIYVGGKQAWNDSDRKNIDWALNGAMTDPYLNHVIMQYFNDQSVSASYRGSFILNGFSQPRVTQGNVRDLVKLLHTQGNFNSLPLDSTIINFMLPRGVILEDPDSGGQRASVTDGVIPHEEESSSLAGLGGYHGSVHVGSQTLYYAVGVYSEKLSNGQTNGIPVFNQSWKNVVATFYHELQEARTDPDVDDAIVTGQERYVGWVSEEGEEIGDGPVEEDGQDGKLDQVFVEVPLANGGGKVPVQLCYSNAVHGPEGPIQTPHRGSPLPIPPLSPPPGSTPTPSPSPSPKPQPTNPPANNGGVDAGLDQIEKAWDHLSQDTKLKILNLIKDAGSVEEHGFGT
jgi:hypothetical protein